MKKRFAYALVYKNELEVSEMVMGNVFMFGCFETKEDAEEYLKEHGDENVKIKKVNISAV
jgi:hypothetical protein